MPPALSKCKLPTLPPTAEEMLAAKATINAMDPTAINSKNTSMRSFLLKNPDLKAISAKGLEVSRIVPHSAGEVQAFGEALQEPPGARDGP